MGTASHPFGAMPPPTHSRSVLHDDDLPRPSRRGVDIRKVTMMALVPLVPISLLVLTLLLDRWGRWVLAPREAPAPVRPPTEDGRSR